MSLSNSLGGKQATAFAGANSAPGANANMDATAELKPASSQ